MATIATPTQKADGNFEGPPFASAVKRPSLEPVTDQLISLDTEAQMVGDQTISLLQAGCEQGGPERTLLAAAIKLAPQASDLETCADQRTREKRQDQGTAPFTDVTEP